MTMATRCPACGTMFRVVQDQLRVSAGWVRCGRCGEAFNALEALLDVDVARPQAAEEVPGAQPAAAPADTAAADVGGVVFDDAPADTEGEPVVAGGIASIATEAGLPDDLPARVAASEVEPPAPEAVEVDLVEPAHPADDPPSPTFDLDSAPITIAEPASASPAPAAAAAPATDLGLTFASEPMPIAFDAPPTGTIVSDPYIEPGFTWTDDAASPSTAAEGAAEAGPPVDGAETEPTHDDSGEETLPARAPLESVLPATEGAVDGARAEPALDAPVVAPSFLRSAERAERWQRPWVRGLLGLGVVAAALALAAQAAYAYRDWLAATVPTLRPALAEACTLLSCRIGELRQIEMLTVESSGLVRAEGTQMYRLSVVLRNRAALELAAPAIDLSLTDVQGRLIARRVLTMADLGLTLRTLKSGSELPIQVALGVNDRTVSGYTVEIFYP